MATKRQKTAWYMMAFVTLIVVLISLFLPINSSQSDGSVFTFVINLFSEEPDPESDGKVSVIVGGDVMLGRSVMAVSLDRDDVLHPFRKIASKMESADISFVNLENAIIVECPKVYRNTLKFCAIPQMLDGMKLAGIDVVTLANNHSRNYGEEGYRETLGHLDANGINYTDYSLKIIEKEKMKFGFLGMNFVTTEPTEDDYNLVRESADSVDVLILGLHWGVEYTSDPREAQREWAMQFIENGADVIVGHHPHWVQSREEINGVPVYYSLGNLIFDQMESTRTKSGLLVELIFEKGELIETREIPTYMEDWAQPSIVVTE